MRKLLIALFSFVAFQCKASERAPLVYGQVKILKKSDKRKVRFKDVVQVDGPDFKRVLNLSRNSLCSSSTNQAKLLNKTHKRNKAYEGTSILSINDLVGLNDATDGLLFIDPETGNYI